MSSAWEKVGLRPAAGTQINSRFQSSARGGITSYPCVASALHQRPAMRKHPLHNLEREGNGHFSAKDLTALYKPERAWLLQCAGSTPTEKGFQEQSETVTCPPPWGCPVWPYPAWAHSGRGTDLYQFCMALLALATETDRWTDKRLTLILVPINRKLSQWVRLKWCQDPGIFFTIPRTLAFTPPWMLPQAQSSWLDPSRLVLFQHKQLAQGRLLPQCCLIMNYLMVQLTTFNNCSSNFLFSLLFIYLFYSTPPSSSCQANITRRYLISWGYCFLKTLLMTYSCL